MGQWVYQLDKKNPSSRERNEGLGGPGVGK